MHLVPVGISSGVACPLPTLVQASWVSRYQNFVLLSGLEVFILVAPAREQTHPPVTYQRFFLILLKYLVLVTEVAPPSAINRGTLAIDIKTNERATHSPRESAVDNPALLGHASGMLVKK